MNSIKISFMNMSFFCLLFLLFNSIAAEDNLKDDEKRLHTAYSLYPKKAKEQTEKAIMLMLPNNCYKIMENKNWKTIPNFYPGMKVGGDQYILSNTNRECYLLISLRIATKSSSATNSIIRKTFHEYYGAMRLNTWNSKDIPVLETPFDFTANYCEGKFFSLDASYYNLMLAIQVDDSKLKDPLPLTELNPIMDRFASLFHGYEKAEKITPVDYLNCEITSEKDSTVKVTWSFKEKFKELADQLWILAVSNNGDLAMGSNTVTIKLPEKEKETKTSLTFYFISEDGKSYSAQTVKIPENLKSRK